MYMGFKLYNILGFHLKQMGGKHFKSYKTFPELYMWPLLTIIYRFHNQSNFSGPPILDFTETSTKKISAINDGKPATMSSLHRLRAYTHIELSVNLDVNIC
jgi:hypothetical protein